MVVIAHLVHRRTYFTFVTIRRVDLADLRILNCAIIYKIVVLERNQFKTEIFSRSSLCIMLNRWILFLFVATLC